MRLCFYFILLFLLSRMVVTTRRRSMAAQSPPVNESPTQSLYPHLSEAEESSNEDEEDDHEEFSTTHPEPPLPPPPLKLDTSRARSRKHSFNSSSSSFNTSSHQEASRSFPYGKVLVGLAAICIAYWLLSSSGRSPAGPPDRHDFGKVLATVVKAHPAFSGRDREQLRAAADRWFDSSTKDPVVVIIYAADSSSGLLDALTTSTADFLGKKTTVVTSAASTKRAHLHATFENTLKGGTKSTIGMREIEKLAWDAPLVLHSFADALHIADSRPLIWLQVTRDDTLEGISCDSAIERTLTSSWIASGGSEDNVAPVISRVLQFTICLDWPAKTEL